MRTLLRTILASLTIGGCLSVARAADNDLFASINGGPGNGAGFVYKYTPAGAQSTFLSGQNRPRGLAFGAGGNIFMATNTSASPSGVINGTIYQVAPDGTATSFATGFGDNVFLEGIAFDSAGNLFVNSSNLSDPMTTTGIVFKITPAGTVTTFGTVPGQAFGIAIDGSDNVFAASAGDDKTIYKFTPAGVRTVFVGPSAFTGGQAPVGLVFDSAGNLFVTAVDTLGGTAEVVKFAPDTTKTVFASGLNNGARGMTFDNDGNLFVAEVPPTASGDILKFSPAGSRTTFASGLGSPSGNGGAEYLVVKGAPCGCVGPAGPPGPPGPVGPPGAQGPPGVGLVPGAVLLMNPGSPAPAGFNKIGTTDLQYRDLANKSQKITLDVYQKP